MLLIDPYVYRHLSFKDIQVLNRTAEMIHEQHEQLDINAVISAIFAVYRTGMDERALLIHTRNYLKV